MNPAENQLNNPTFWELIGLWTDEWMAQEWFGWSVIGVVFFVALLGLFLIRIIASIRLERGLVAVSEDPHLAAELIRGRFSDSALLRRSRQFERLARKHGPMVIRAAGLDKLWVEQLKVRSKVEDLLRVLEHTPETGLFSAFRVCLEKPALAAELFRWLEERDDLFHLRRLAFAEPGAAFDGQRAFHLLSDKMDQTRALAGDPEWAARYFAVQVLAHDEDERGHQAMWEAFEDHHPLVRKTACLWKKAPDQERFFTAIRERLLNDPAMEVRSTAWRRIQQEFPERSEYSLDEMEEGQALRVLEQLDTGLPAHENFAMSLLRHANLEIRFLAAEFLQRSGVLVRLCLSADLGDEEGMERTQDLLRHAAQVQVSSFLTDSIEKAGPGGLLVCARLMKDLPHRQPLVSALARRVFRLPVTEPGLQTLYTETLACVAEQGDKETLSELSTELIRRRSDQRLVGLVLNALPERGAPVFMEPLMGLLLDEEFAPREPLRAALARMSDEMLLPRLVETIRMPWEEVPVSVRMESVRLLGEMNLDYCLQTVLENLWVLPLNEARGFMPVLEAFPEKLLLSKVNGLLDTTDSRIRAAIIAALPAVASEPLRKRVTKALKDVDPDVRIAAIWSIIDYKSSDWLDDGLEMLRDPLPRVRAETARAIGFVPGTKPLRALAERLLDEEEAESVRLSAIEGLSTVEHPDSVSTLVPFIERGEPLASAAKRALSGKTANKQLEKLFDHFKDASPDLRAALADVFRSMGEKGGAAMAELLKADVASLKPLIQEVLAETGYLELHIRRLSNQDPVVRRQSAKFLTTVGSLPALRGLVLAAKDPDEEVRVLVVRALEQLGGEQGGEVLDALRKDPRRKVRRYTAWALERLRAKSL